MYKDEFNLTSDMILEKDFKIDTRGYRLKEVDQFLDLVIADYEHFYAIIRNLEKEIENLKIEPGKELCTLITCTPYGVNTHRILVKGERVPYDGASIEADTLTMIKKTVDPKTVFGICFIIFIIYLFVINKKPKKQKGNTGDQHDEEKTSSNGS